VALCLHCAQTLDGDAIVCPACGTPVPLPVPKGRYLTGGRRTDGALGFGGGCLAAIAFFVLDAFLGGAMINQGGFVAAYIAAQIAMLIGLIVYYRKAIKGDLSEAMRTGLVVFTICTCVTLGLLATCDGLFMNFKMN
jgi:hypothetical protein